MITNAKNISYYDTRGAIFENHKAKWSYHSYKGVIKSNSFEIDLVNCYSEFGFSTMKTFTLTDLTHNLTSND